MLLLLINFQQLYRFICARPASSKFRKETHLLQNTKKGKIALVLGNGPSLMKLIPSEVAASRPDIWVVNDFFKMPFAGELPVSHYVLSDGAYFEGENLENDSKLGPIVSYARGIDLTFVLPHWMQSVRQSHSLSAWQKYYFDDRELSAWTSNTSPAKPRGYIGLTLYKALAFALHMGYDQIYVLGMDNTEFIKYKSDQQNRILLEGNHAYKEANVSIDLSEHFLDGLAGAFIDYSHTFGDLAKFKGPIINLDNDSLSTAFPKLDSHPWVK